MINLISTLYPSISLSYPLIRRRGVSFLAFMLVSVLPLANASELQSNDLVTIPPMQNVDEGVSASELQAILVAAEVPTELWVAVGKNEFGIYEPDTAEIIAYVALYQSRKLAINTVDRILTSRLPGSSSTPSISHSSSASQSGSSITGGSSSISAGGLSSGGGIAGQSIGDSSDETASSSAKTSDSATTDSPTNSDFAQLLTENYSEFEEPAAAISQLGRVSALPDNPELSPIFVTKVDDASAGSGRAGISNASLASTAVPSPGSLWLLLFAPLFVPRPKQATA